MAEETEKQNIQRPQLFHAIHRFRKLQAWSPPFQGISKGEFATLHLLQQLEKKKAEDVPGVKASVLSTAAEMSRPAVSQMLNALEGKELIERVIAQTDRRVVYVRLTQAGRERLTACARQMNRLLDVLIEKLGAEDTQELTRIIGKLYEIMEKIDPKDYSA